MICCDFLVIGGGVIGLNIARELKRRQRDVVVHLIEKEPSCGFHASGRNSGVLHAGFYYSSDSLKAKFTRDGNRALTEYCERKNISLNRCGKLVVAKNVQEDKMLDELLARGKQNDVELHEISSEEARRIEPRAKTFSRALFSPTTSSASPQTVMLHMEQDALVEGVVIHKATRFLDNQEDLLVTDKNNFSARYVVNAAGLYADKIARKFGFCSNHAIVPFKGLYLKSSEPVGAIRTNIYPVPDLKNPFLGVHFTVQSNGGIKLGPTAIPALWREQYEGLSQFRADEFFDIAARTAGLLLSSNFEFRRLAFAEFRKYSRNHLVSLASELATEVSPATYRRWAKPGIRAQLLNTKDRKLEMDFVIEADSRSLHILNAVSPGWTCSLPFAGYVVDKIEGQLAK